MTSVVTQIQYEVLEVVIKYVIDYVTDQVTVTAPNAAGKGAAQAAAVTTPTGLAALQGDARGNSAPVAPNNPLVTPTAEESSSPTNDGSDDGDDDDDTVTEVVVTTVTSVGPDSTVVHIVYADATEAASSNGADGTAVPVNGVNYPKTKKHRTRHRTRTRTRTKSKSKSSSATASALASAATVAAPATTGAGTVSGCTQWYVAKSGDYCSLVAGNYGISTETFESWNPSVGSDCRTMYAGWAYCVATLANATTPASSTTSASAAASAAGTSFPANYPINKSSTMATSASPSQQSSAQTTAATSAAASAATNAAQPLGPTGAGTVAGCTQWYTAVSGDYCSKIAGEFGISTSTFIAWNPSVGSSCLTLYAGYSYCVAAPSSGATSAPASANQQPTSAATSGYASAPPGGSSSSGGSTTPSGDYSYQFYQGDGTTAQGWPAMSDWVDFDTMWTFNLPIMSQSCTQFGTANNSPDESADIKTAIKQVSSSSGVDPRFILAIIMQESNGCVRVVSKLYNLHVPFTNTLPANHLLVRPQPRPDARLQRPAHLLPPRRLARLALPHVRDRRHDPGRHRGHPQQRPRPRLGRRRLN